METQRLVDNIVQILHVLDMFKSDFLTIADNTGNFFSNLGEKIIQRISIFFLALFTINLEKKSLNEYVPYLELVDSVTNCEPQTSLCLKSYPGRL